MSPKVEFMIHRIEDNVIITGVIVHNSHKVTLGGARTMLSLDPTGVPTIFMEKEEREITTSDGKPTKDYSIGELLHKDIWYGIKSPKAGTAAGFMVRQQNQLFADESEDKVSRMAFISVLKDEENVFSVKGKSIFRSVDFKQHDAMFIFSLKEDESIQTEKTLTEAGGNSLSKVLISPLWTRDDGTKYGLNSDLSLHNTEISRKQTTELIEFGSVSATTKLEVKAAGIGIYSGGDYVDFLRALNNICPIALDVYDRLLTKEEQDEIRAASHQAMEMLHKERRNNYHGKNTLKVGGHEAVMLA